MVFTDFKKLACSIVNDSMRVGTKQNPSFLQSSKKYPWMKGKFSLSFAARQLNKSEREAEKFLKKYEDVSYGPLLERKGKSYSVREKIGQVVQIIYHQDNRKLAVAVRDECWKNQAFTIMTETDMESTRRFYELHSESSLAELPAVSALIEENTDMTIRLDSFDWSAWSKEIPVEKIASHRPANMRLHDISDRKNKPWILVGWPHRRISDERNFPFEKLEKIMFDCIEYSYSREISSLVSRYSGAFRGAEEIRIEADDGTDLSFSIKGRRLNKDVAEYDGEGIMRGDVGKNMPTGEIFFAPIENSANGKLIIPVSVIPGEGMAENLALYFRDGRVVKSTATKGGGMLERFVEKNGKDSDLVAEFGIGLNKKAEFTRGEIIIDEKIFGSIHIAIGWNKGFGGKTNAASHLDFIKDLRSCGGKVFADGKLVIRDGKLV